MNSDGYVSLDRQFSLVPKSYESEHDEAFYGFGLMGTEGWGDIEKKFRCVILAEAGAGKTEEMRQRAVVLSRQGKASFFIRIEDIEADFYDAFEVGESSQFNQWLKSTDEAWFFLDSIDEARLENPRMFGKALRKFAKGIRSGVHRAHIILSSRPYSWRPREDRRLLDEILPFAEPKTEERNGNDDGSSDSKSALTLYSLRPLDVPRIRQFCEDRQADGVNRLLQEIERADLWSLAERPFDLDGILAKWNDDGFLGGRLELLRHNIDRRLVDSHSEDRAQRKPLNIEVARDGARRLAAAVVLTGEAGITVPDSTAIRREIDAESVLTDWDPADVRSLLDRGIFNDVIYGAVRFRHRDVRELLAAEWFNELLKSGSSRYSIESLVFRNQYGENIITPRLRPLLPWLILYDEAIRQRVLSEWPEIAVEGGDPSKLPLSTRKRLLREIVSQIASGQDNRAARDNSAISKIASSDLSEDASQLISEHCENDDAVFFLGRLVWQGEMSDCVSGLVSIAINSARGLYARIASIRAVMTCGGQEEKQSIWRGLKESQEELPRELLAELVDNLEPDSESVEHVLGLIKSLPAYREFSTSGLDDALVRFIERCPTEIDRKSLRQITEGFYHFLTEPPFIDKAWCDVSEEYAWLLNPAIRAVERLIKARDSAVFEKASISLMLMVPTALFYRDHEIRARKNELEALVPQWPELNDALYWASIEEENVRRLEKLEARLVSDGQLSWQGHFWKFNLENIKRLIEEIRYGDKSESEKLVALSTSFRVYLQAGEPSLLLESLREAVAANGSLADRLEKLLDPPESEEVRKFEERQADRIRRLEIKEQERQSSRDRWIFEVRANPERVRNPSGVGKDEITYDLIYLFREIDGDSIKTSRTVGANWQALELVFGREVALAYRDAVVQLWRHFKPELQSETGFRGSSVPYALLLAMAGLEIESTENEAFADRLSESEALRALRYITWEINGFPSWFEQIHRVFPKIAENALSKELIWELDNTGSQKLPHSVLHDIVYHGTWLHDAMAPRLLDWLRRNPGALKANINEVINILVSGGIDAPVMASIAAKETSLCTDPMLAATWYAVLVDCDPSKGIAQLQNWLSSLDSAEAELAAQRFITQLIGGRHTTIPLVKVGRFQRPVYLKSLYVLMHKYIVATQDINRSGRGVFTPELRDDAQDARDQLFNLLAGIPGEQTYAAIKELANEHPVVSYRQRMHFLATKRAQEDGDLEPWSGRQVSQFQKNQQLVPETHRQLYELAVNKLVDLKHWLERGNDSPWKTWRRVTDEIEMRTNIAGWLRGHSQDRYTTAEEPELANSQRMDIWLQNSNVTSPVPIELKLLDKQWSGPELCERLRNQLAGDYLREESAGCGVFLLVAGEVAQGKRWEIGGQRVGLNNLGYALESYWSSIAMDYPGVNSIAVIVIDLNLRGHVSQS